MNKLIYFIKTGKVDKDKCTIRAFLELYISYFIIAIPISFPIILLRVLDLLPLNVLEKPDVSLKYLSSIIVLGPIVEELCFRLFLKKTRINISIGLSIFIIAIAKSLFGSNFWYEWYILTIPVFGLFYYLLGTKKYGAKIPTLLLIHISVLSFGFIHLFNFVEIKGWMYLIFPLLTAPQILMGYILSYVRLRFGFRYCMFLHIITNFTVSLPILIQYTFNEIL